MKPWQVVEADSDLAASPRHNWIRWYAIDLRGQRLCEWINLTISQDTGVIFVCVGEDDRQNMTKHMTRQRTDVTPANIF